MSAPSCFDFVPNTYLKRGRIEGLCLDDWPLEAQSWPLSKTYVIFEKKGKRRIPMHNCNPPLNAKSNSSRTACLALMLCLLCLQSAFGQEGSLKWSLDTGGAVNSSPAIGKEGIVYVGSNDEKLRAIEPDGTEKWSFSAGSAIRIPPVIDDDGTIYIGTQDGRVIAVNLDGSQRWEFDPGIGKQVNSEMALAADGTLYASIGGSSEAMVYAINPDGSQFWSFKPDTGIRGIVIGPGGLVILSDSNGRVYALDSFGTRKWDRDDTNGVNHPAVISDDGTIYVVSNSELLLYDVEGNLLHEFPIQTPGNTPSTAVNGDIYLPLAIAAGQGALVSVDPSDGSENWRYDVPGRVNTTPAVGYDGIIYFGSDSNNFYALNPDGTLRWMFETGSDIISSPTIAENGTLYFGSNDSLIYALNGISPGLAASSSPKKQRDVRNTGQFGSDVTRRRFFAPHVFYVDDDTYAVMAIRHIGGSAGNPVGTTANFRVDILDRDGSVRFSIEDSVEPGQIKRIILRNPAGDDVYTGAAVIDAPVKDGSFLAPFLTWKLNVSEQFKPLDIGVFFSDPTDAARVHHFPAEANTTKGLGIAIQNIGENMIPCDLTFYTEAGDVETTLNLNLSAHGSLVDFFNESLPNPFIGSATLSCQDPVVAIAVVQDFLNGGFPTDIVTVKGVN